MQVTPLTPNFITENPLYLRHMQYVDAAYAVAAAVGGTAAAVAFYVASDDQNAVRGGVLQDARHTSHVTRYTSHVTRHALHVTRHTSHVTRHASLNMHDTSRITRL